ncbi:Inositol oxygenase 1 [Bienertia sinuspersici]
MTIIIEHHDYGVNQKRNAEEGKENGVEVGKQEMVLDKSFMVRKMREEYGKLNRVEMSIWECCELLNDVVDENLGKVLLLPSFGELPQWAVVGDTYPVGCAFDKSIVHHKYFALNPDYNNPAYNTKYGIYSEGCGLENVLMSFGHDDYMYIVAKENNTTLPSAALFIIRYHSFYALHKEGAYKYLMNEEDKENLKWLHIFNKYDLYSKSKVRVDVEKVKPYYLSLIEKYFPAKLKW